MVALATHLPRDRFEVDFVLLLERGPLADDAEAAGSTVHLLGARHRRDTSAITYGLAAVRASARYVPVMRAGHYDIVDAWLFNSYGLEAVVHPLTRIPVFVAGRRSLGGFKERFSALGRTVDAVARRTADAIVANSYAVRDDTLARENVAPARLQVIRNGVELPAPMPATERERIRAGWGVDPGDVLIGTLASLQVGKGHDELIEAAARVIPSLPNARFRVLGEGPEGARLQRSIEERGLGERFVLGGVIPNARTLLGAFDILVHPSEAEGLPNAVLEAAAAGLAIVATDAGGTTEIVEDGRTGILVPIGDVDGIGDALVRLGLDPGLRAALGDRARDHVARAFGMDRFVSETAALYEELAIRKGVFRP